MSARERVAAYVGRLYTSPAVTRLGRLVLGWDGSAEDPDALVIAEQDPHGETVTVVHVSPRPETPAAEHATARLMADMAAGLQHSQKIARPLPLLQPQPQPTYVPKDKGIQRLMSPGSDPDGPFGHVRLPDIRPPQPADAARLTGWALAWSRLREDEKP